MAPLFVRSGRHPVVIGVLIALAAISVYGLVTDPPSKSIDLALAYPQRLIWSAQILIASATTLAGVAYRAPLPGMRVECIGWVGIAVGLGCYEVMLLATTPWSSAGFVFCLVLGVAAGAAFRVRQIVADVKKLHQVRALVA